MKYSKNRKDMTKKKEEEFDEALFGFSQMTEKYKNAIKEQKYDLALKYRNEILALEKEIKNRKVFNTLNNLDKNTKNIFFDEFVPKTEVEIDLKIQEALNLKLIEPTHESTNLLKDLIVLTNNKESQTDCLHPLNFESDLFNARLNYNYFFVLLDDDTWKILLDFYLEKTTHFAYSYFYSLNRDEKAIQDIKNEAETNNIIKTHLKQDFKVYSTNYQGTEVFHFEIIKIITLFTKALKSFLKDFESVTHLAINENEIEVYDPVFFNGNTILMTCFTVQGFAEIKINKEEKIKLKKLGVRFLPKTPFKKDY